MQKEPSYSVSSSGFWKEFGSFLSMFNNCIHVLFSTARGAVEKKCLHCVCVSERGSQVSERDLWLCHLWGGTEKSPTPDTPAAPSTVPGASESPAHCWVMFLGGAQGAAPREVLWGVCVFPRELLGRWHHQVPRRDVEQHPLWLLHVPGGASHLPGSWVCQSGVCQGEKTLILPRWICQVLGFFFFPLTFSVWGTWRTGPCFVQSPQKHFTGKESKPGISRASGLSL